MYAIRSYYGYFAFVQNRDLPSPHSFRELADSDLKIVIQDPRSSTPGLGLLMWVKAAYGDEAPAIWKGLSDNIVTVTKGWSEAYGRITSYNVCYTKLLRNASLLHPFRSAYPCPNLLNLAE